MRFVACSRCPRPGQCSGRTPAQLIGRPRAGGAGMRAREHTPHPPPHPTTPRRDNILAVFGSKAADGVQPLHVRRTGRRDVGWPTAGAAPRGGLRHSLFACLPAARVRQHPLCCLPTCTCQRAAPSRHACRRSRWRPRWATCPSPSPAGYPRPQPAAGAARVRHRSATALCCPGLSVRAGARRGRLPAPLLIMHSDRFKQPPFPRSTPTPRLQATASSSSSTAAPSTFPGRPRP